jgi:hypothetical protein
MPGVTIHLHLGQLILDHWSSSKRGACFPARDPECRNAFLMGCMGPDVGYLPGGPEILSQLAHDVTPGQLTRTIVGLASTPLETAFAWGWVAHVLADILIHPLVGCGVGELVHGSPSHFLSGDDDRVGHVRVEAGLDALYARRLDLVGKLRLRPVFDLLSIAFLQEAYRATYGAAPERSDFARGHRNAARRLMQGLRLMTVTSMVLPTHPGLTGRPGSSLGRIRSFVSRQTVSLAFLLPAPPPLWLINAVRDVEENFVEIFQEEVELGGAGIPDVNLDTGRPAHEEVAYTGRVEALAWLEAAGGAAREPVVPAMGAA